MKTSLIKKIKTLVALFLTGVVGILYFVVFKLDASTLPIDSSLIPESVDSAYHHRAPVVLVSYADGPPVFFKNQNSLLQSAINKGFDATISYRKGHLDPEFYEKNRAILDQPRGAGYWVWKPYVILKAMQMFPDNTVIVYADSGVVFRKSLLPLIEMLQDAPLVFVGNGKPVTCRTHLKMEARHVLQLTEQDPRLDAQNLWAFFMVIKNTPKTRAFIEEWLKMCLIKDAITDEPYDKNIQDKQFNGHLHDGPLLSLVAANHCDDIRVIPKNILRNEYGVVNFHRHPEDENLSPLFDAVGVPHWLSALLFNNVIAQEIRKRLP